MTNKQLAEEVLKLWTGEDGNGCGCGSCLKNMLKQALEKQKAKYITEFEEIIKSLGEHRGKNNELIGITLDNNFTTNSIDMLKDKLLDKLKTEVSNEQ